MARVFTCSLCNTVLVEHPTSFLKDGKFWTVNVLLCKNEKCLKRRGGVATEHRTEMGANR